MDGDFFFLEEIEGHTSKRYVEFFFLSLFFVKGVRNEKYVLHRVPLLLHGLTTD